MNIGKALNNGILSGLGSSLFNLLSGINWGALTTLGKGATSAPVPQASAPLLSSPVSNSNTRTFNFNNQISGMGANDTAAFDAHIRRVTFDAVNQAFGAA